MDSRQEGQTGSREIVKRGDRQIRQPEGNKVARRVFTAAPMIRGACDFPFGMLSQLLLKTGLLWKLLVLQTPRMRNKYSASACSSDTISIYQLAAPITASGSSNRASGACYLHGIHNCPSVPHFSIGVQLARSIQTRRVCRKPLPDICVQWCERRWKKS
jgi:hypothetical protein